MFEVKPITMPYGPGKGKAVAQLTDDEVAWYAATLTKEPYKSAALEAVEARGLQALLKKKQAKEAAKAIAAKKDEAADVAREVVEAVTVESLAAKALIARREKQAANLAYWTSTPITLECPKCGESSEMRVGNAPGE